MPEFPGDPRLRDIWMIHSTRNGVPPEPAPEVSRETEDSIPDQADRPDPREEPTAEEQNAVQAAPKRSHHKKRV